MGYRGSLAAPSAHSSLGWEDHPVGVIKKINREHQQHHSMVGSWLQHQPFAPSEVELYSAHDGQVDNGYEGA